LLGRGRGEIRGVLGKDLEVYFELSSEGEGTFLGSECTCRNEYDVFLYYAWVCRIDYSRMVEKMIPL
jgi:hypothetical protein